MNLPRLLVFAALLASPALATTLPSIDEPLRTGSKAPSDAAVVIGIEDYLRPGVPSVPYARRDAQAFNDFLVSTRGVPTSRVQLLEENASATKIRSLISGLGKIVSEGGVAWVYFAGHGGASLNGGGRMLLGDDVSQDPESFDGGGVLVSEIEELAGAGGGRVVVVVDACYTGTGRDGKAFLTGQRTIVPAAAMVKKPSMNVVWTAASAGQTSGPLDAAQHGAFTYFALGALRGWADGGIDGVRDGNVTLDEAQTYVQRTLATAQITSQTPEVIGARDVVLSMRAKEEAPVISVPREAPRPATVPRTGEAVVVTDGKELEFEVLARQVEAKQQEAADERRRAAEAATLLEDKEKDARSLKVELERRLAEERREKMDVAAAELQASATRDYAAIAALVTNPTKEAQPVLEAWLARYGAPKVTVDGASEAVVITEVGKVRTALAKAGGSGGDFDSPTLGTMKWIPAGTFTMGSAFMEDAPQHDVTLTKGYWLMEHEVTQGEYRAVMRRNPSKFPKCGPQCPVERVSWADAVAFAKAASAGDGVTYRLPTEAEWERAARGGQSTIYAGSDEAGAVAWTAETSAATTHAGCGLLRNGYGLCDMTGNVREWVSDWSGGYPGSVTDPSGAASSPNRVDRGGDWNDGVSHAGVAWRSYDEPDHGDPYIGFRLARSSP